MTNFKKGDLINLNLTKGEKSADFKVIVLKVVNIYDWVFCHFLHDCNNENYFRVDNNDWTNVLELSTLRNSDGVKITATKIC